MKRGTESIAIVTRESRLSSLKRKRGTLGAAKFALAQAHLHRETETLSMASYEEYEEEDQLVTLAVDQIRSTLDLGYPVIEIDRHHLPNFDFNRCKLVITVGQDGLVANTGKYALQTPILGINPDSSRYDGILSPFAPRDAEVMAKKTLAGRSRVRNVTLAQATLSDGQVIRAFNDLFIGRRSHASARYVLRCIDGTESQSSSGILISTGAGSTGWLSSIGNMARGLTPLTGATCEPKLQFPWEEQRLAWVVREPFTSRHSSAQFVASYLHADDALQIESLMPEEGVVFSDGIEEDFLEFNSGVSAAIEVAAEHARVVVG